MIQRLVLPAFVLVLASSAELRAQTIFPEVEPNNDPSTGTVVGCMRAGDSILGLSTGSLTTPGSTLASTADYFRVQMCPLPAGIYRHRLTLTTLGAVGHIGSIVGLDVVDLPPPTITSVESILQSSLSTSVPARFCQWYGFGRGEQIDYRVIGTASTTVNYLATLTTDALQPAVIPNVFRAGLVTITTENQGHSTDTELHVYDANLQPIPGFLNDDTPAALPGGGSGYQSTLQRTFAQGTYYLLVSRFNMCDHLLTGADDHYQTGDVLGGPDAIVATDSTPSSNVSFAITDVTGTFAFPATMPAGPFEILWYRFTVGPPGVVSAYCFGDASGAGCPCSNYGLLGNGCASSVNSFGAHLAGTGMPSIAGDTIVLAGSGMPNSSALYFQGTASIATFFGDGLRCAGGSVIRFGTKSNNSGLSQYPALGDLPVSVRGLCSAGSTRHYQVWYRNSAAYCTPSTFNLTNGVTVTWGP
jgi:hypothetical protein